MVKKKYEFCQNDVFIIDHFEKYEEIASKLKNETVFDNVSTCKVKYIITANTRNKIIRKIKRTYYFANWKKIVKKAMNLSNSYDNVFVATADEIRTFAVCKLRKNNPNIHSYYLEDGTIDYLNNPHPKNKKSFLWNIFLRVIGLERVNELIQDSYVLKPELISNAEYNLHQIPTISSKEDKELVLLLNRVFNYTPIDIKEPLIHLQAKLSPHESNISISKLMHKLQDIYGEDKILTKLHPRIPLDMYNDMHCFPASNTSMWESIVLNNDYSDKTLIAHCSTALLTPKTIFNQEPTLIFLYKLYPHTALSSESRIQAMDNLVCRLASVYSDPSKVFVPISEEELFNFIESKQILR